MAVTRTKPAKVSLANINLGLNSTGVAENRRRRPLEVRLLLGRDHRVPVFDLAYSERFLIYSLINMKRGSSQFNQKISHVTLQGNIIEKVKREETKAQHPAGIKPMTF